MQIYLPDDLYTEVKSRKLLASELLQNAIRAEIDREDKIMAMARFVEDSIREFGEPSDEALAKAEELVARIKAHLQPPAADETARSDQHAPKAS
ncbi:hypothetical protein ACFVWG_02085 [Kribbella sp. NPDC058245]|uniref:hypothetical protein n=1 Tax=Kribbella sp. NPDC058245 TaxID=3346399 RepID=UPI0036EF7AEC